MVEGLAIAALATVALVAGIVLGAVQWGWSARGEAADAALALERERLAIALRRVEALLAQDQADLAGARALVEVERQAVDALLAAPPGSAARRVLLARAGDGGPRPSGDAPDPGAGTTGGPGGAVAGDP